MSDSRLLPAASGTTEYRWPDEEPPPRGCKLLLLTSGGVAVVGDWTDDSNLVAWAPLPRRPVRRGEATQWTEDPDQGVE